MKKFLLIPLMALCICSCYHTDTQTIQNLVLVNHTLMSAKNVVEENNRYTYYLIRKAFAIDPRKVKPSYDSAMIAMRISDVMVARLQKVKAKLAKEVGGMDTYCDDSLVRMNHKDEVDKCKSILLNGTDGDAWTLKTMLVLYRQKMTGLARVPEKDIPLLNIDVQINNAVKANGELASWEDYNFWNATLVADIATLTRLQLDIRNCEASIIKYIQGQISAPECRLDRFAVYFDKYFGGKAVATHEELDDLDRISFSPPVDASFSIQFVESGKPIVLTSENIMLTPEMRKEMKKLKKGDKLIFENVQIKEPDGFIRKYEGPTIVVQ